MGHHNYFQSQNSCFSWLLENSQLVPLQISSLLSSPFFVPIRCTWEFLSSYFIPCNCSFVFPITSFLWLPLTPFYSFSVTALFADREGYVKVWIHSTIFTKVSAKIVSLYLYRTNKHITWKVYPINLNLLRHWRKYQGFFFPSFSRKGWV